MFEGYIGIHLWGNQQVQDLLFSIILALFILFGITFRHNSHLFIRTVKECWSAKKRQNLFEVPAQENKFYYFFMQAQAVVLCAIATYTLLRYQKGGLLEDTRTCLQELGICVGSLIFFYVFKQSIYSFCGKVFAEAEQYKQWKDSYETIIGLWGMALYAPVLWLAFVGNKPLLSIILFITLYILSRFAIIHKMVQIFYTKSKGLFYISLYLCALEILPVYFLYKGIIYLYNFIG